MKTAPLFAIILAVVLPACGEKKGGAETPPSSENEASSHLLTEDELKAVEEQTSYRAPDSPNPEGVTEDDIVVVREGAHYRMGYVGEDGSFVEIPERGVLKIDDSGFLPPYPLYEGKVASP